MKKVLMLALSFFVVSLTFSISAVTMGTLASEPPATEWNRTYGGTNEDYATSVVQTSDGGYVIAGFTYSFGAGDQDSWLVKTDSGGNTQWNKTYGGTSEDRGLSIVQTSDGGYTMVGNTYSFGAGGSDFWLIRTDPSGNVQWNKTYGGANFDYPWCLVQTVDGGYMLAGSTYSFGYGGEDAYLIKTGANGTVQWSKTFGGRLNDRVLSASQTDDGGYILAGDTWSFGAGGADAWLIKTDAKGDLEWDRMYGGTNYDYGECVVQTDDGGYAMAGTTYSFGAGGGDFWLIKTDADGNVHWIETFGGTKLDEARSVLQTSDGGYALAGETSSFGAGGKDFWLVKTNASGNPQWNETYGGFADDFACSIIQLSQEGYALVGGTSSFGAGDLDFWLIKLAPAPPSPRQLSVKVYGAHDYLPWENVKVKVWALVADVSTMEPVSDANLTITIYDPEDNLWINDTMTEKLNHGIYLWESNQTVRQIFRHHKKGVYLVHVQASYGDGPTASDILTFHIDPPPEEDNQLPMIIGTTITSIAILAIAILYIIKKQSP